MPAPRSRRHRVLRPVALFLAALAVVWVVRGGPSGARSVFFVVVSAVVLALVLLLYACLVMFWPELTLLWQRYVPSLRIKWARFEARRAIARRRERARTRARVVERARDPEWKAAARRRALLRRRGFDTSLRRALLGTRETRPQLLAVLALLVVVVHAAVTGYVDVWTILIAVAVSAVAALLSADLWVVAVLGGTAVLFAVATVFVADMFQGSTEGRALAVSLAAVVLPVLFSERLFRSARLRLGDRALRTRHQAGLVVLTLVLGFLGWTRADWMPGVLHGCYTLPTSTGITVLRATGDGQRCYGLLDTDDPGVFAASAFGLDPATTDVEHAILANNRPLRDGDLTVVWMGALSCNPLPADPAQCADGRDYPAERDQLRALLLAQHQIPGLHVVIADATQDVAHADDLAKLIVSRRSVLGSRLVVIGGGDSRDTTQAAINRLLDAGIPFIAPNLLADLGAPGRPFVDRAGYLQLAPSNLAYASDAVARLTHQFPGGFRLDVFQHPNPTDQYTTSLVNDLLATAAGHARTVDQIDGTDCASSAARPPTVLFFADRWTQFADFVHQVADACGYAGPRLVVADGSVSRFMANYQLRAVSSAPWPVDYYVGGPGCADLTQSAVTTLAGRLYAERDLMHLDGPFTCADGLPAAHDGQVLGACTLDAAVKLTSRPCRPNDLGGFLVPAWDAVMLANALLPAHPPAGRDYLTSLELTGFPLSTGALATVHAGRLAAPTIAVELWHVSPLDDPTSIWERPSPGLTTR